MPHVPQIARSWNGTAGDGVKLIAIALGFWALYFGALFAGIDVSWIHAALTTAWVFGIAIVIFKHLWDRRWFWLVVGLGLPVHSLLLWVLPTRTPFDVGMSIVMFNLELWGLVALIAQFENIGRNRIRRHASRRGV